MMKKVRKVKVNGITINLTMEDYRYEVEILIPEEARNQEIYIKNKDFIFHFKMKYKCKGIIRIVLNQCYKKDEQGLVNIHNHSKLVFEQPSYSGSITLSPKFYIPSKIIKKVEEENKKSKIFSKLCGTKTTPKPTESIYTNYKHNNAAKPYSGGKVSPK